MSIAQGVLFLRNENEKLKWFEDGDEDKDIKYKGEIENGLPNGQGTYTDPDGDKYEGEWKDGKKWNGIQYEKNGNVDEKYVNGVKQ